MVSGPKKGQLGGEPRKRGAAAESSSYPLRPSRSPKGGGEKWVKMAGAMRDALEHLRTFYQTLERAKEVSGGETMTFHVSEAAALQGEIAAAANILKTGLKAR